ncbi:MAG: hypothetical protein E6J62_06555 [Deltaproteobacteria bacterium]|nr:MAG: hypothetical protein E6J85_14895 [Deltaproteobacteria bacterium]TMB36826.1 MAG: hypothetical protein E6J62_06555 [Deltaproteobacteria bacterium]
MKSYALAIVAAVTFATTAHAQDSGTKAASGGAAQTKPQTPGSAEAQVGERAPGDASSSTSQEGRPRAGIEVGTASATQGGRTDNGTPPPRQGATDRPATPADKTDTANNSANRAARQGETEDKEFNRIPDQGATMMPRHQQKKEASAAKKRGKARKDRTTAGGKTVDAPNPEAADTPATKNRKQ